MLMRGVALVVMFATMIGIANPDPFLLIILVMAISATVIQLSYLVGICIRGACSKWLNWYLTASAIAWSGTMAPDDTRTLSAGFAPPVGARLGEKAVCPELV
jgi:hypothetical protein